ncbi:MAG: hypothetical protein K2Q22_10585 [Cytophagales bacterium]|nr:hypothetical protein [Cytophagales bacterium]
MTIERSKDEILVRIPAHVDVSEIQGMLDYLKYKELTSHSTAKQEDADNLATQVNQIIFSKVKQDRGL